MFIAQTVFYALVILAAAGSRNLSYSADYPPQDHGGSDFTLSHGDRLWGLHSNIGIFKVSEGTTVTLRAYDPATTGSGALEIRAQRIEILGEISGRGKGFTGGGGGGAGGWGDLGCYATCATYPGGAGGGAPYGGEVFRGKDGGVGYGGGTCWMGHQLYGCVPIPGVSGYGAHGDGPFAGYGGELGHGNPLGAPGGYAALESNGDLTTDTSTRMGSGGGGGGGDIGGYGGGPAYGAGGRGGASIRLIARDRFSMGPNAIIDARGIFGGDPAGTTGGDASIEGGGLYGSGGGAGGGILIDAWQAALVTFSPGARIRALGGGDASANGGTLKIFYNGATPSLAGVTVLTGRTAIFSTGYPPSKVKDWELY